MINLKFKEWLLKTEGLTEPPLDRVELNIKVDAENGNPQAFPTYELPNKKKMKKKS